MDEKQRNSQRIEDLMHAADLIMCVTKDVANLEQELKITREEICDGAKALLPIVAGHPREFAVDDLGLGAIDGSGKFEARYDCSLESLAEVVVERFNEMLSLLKEVHERETVRSRERELHFRIDECLKKFNQQGK